MNYDQIRQGLLEKQKTYSDRLKERHAAFDQANEVAGSRFSGALSNDIPLDPGSVFNAFNSFQRAGAEFVQPVAADLDKVDNQLLDLDMKLAGQGAGKSSDAAGYEALSKLLGIGAPGAASTSAVKPPPIVKPKTDNKDQKKTPPKQANILGDILASLTKPFVETGKAVGGAAYETYRAGKQAMGDKNAFVNQETGQVVQNPFLNEQELAEYSDPKSALIKGAKNSAGVLSYAVPFGKGASLASKVIAPSAAVGALSSASEDNANPMSILTGAGAGVAGAGVLKGATTLLGKGAGTASKAIERARGMVGKAGSSIVQNADDRAVQEFTRATPTMAANAAEQGRDIAKIAKKYFPNQANYDEAIGTIKERGNGGTLGKRLKDAEAKIQKEIKAAGSTIRFSPDELVKAIEKEAKLLNKTVGNEGNIQALKQLAEDAKKRFAKGATAKQLLDLKRAADSQFGKAVIDEQTGSVTAQTQKMLGNTARTILKSRFKNIQSALDEESEILTLRPILNRARGFEQTTGAGKKAFSWADLVALTTGAAAGGGPTPAGLVLGLGAYGAKKALENPAVEKKAGEVLQRVAGARGIGLPGIQLGGQQAMNASARGASLLTRPANEPAGYPNGQSPEGGGQNVSDHGLDTSNVEQISQEPERKITLEQLYQVLLNPEISSSMKTVVEKMYEHQEKAIKESQTTAKSPKLSEGDKKFAFAGQEAQKALDAITIDGVRSGKTHASWSKVGEFLGIQDPKVGDMKSKLAIARTAAKNALLGASQSEAEVESLLDFVFDFSQPTPILKQRLESFVESMNSYKKTIAGPEQFTSPPAQ